MLEDKTARSVTLTLLIPGCPRAGVLVAGGGATLHADCASRPSTQLQVRGGAADGGGRDICRAGHEGRRASHDCPCQDLLPRVPLRLVFPR